MTQPTLAEQTRALTEQFLGQVPAETRQTIADAFAEIMASDIAAHAKQVGERAPDFKLPSTSGRELTLAELLAKGPVVLSFYRGGWCPYCNLEFKALHKHLPRIRELGAELVAVAPESSQHAAQTHANNALDFDLLSDLGNRVTREYGLLMSVPERMRPLYEQWGLDVPAHNGDDSYELPVPATYLINSAGEIVAAFVERDYTQRMEPADIVALLESL